MINDTKTVESSPSICIVICSKADRSTFGFASDLYSIINPIYKSVLFLGARLGNMSYKL